MTQRSGRAALDSKGAAFHASLLRPGEGLGPAVPCGTRAGPSLPGPGCRAVVVPSATRTQTTLAATVAGARHVPVGWTVLVECVSRKRDALRDSADGTRLEGRDPRKHGWQPWRGARLRQDQDGSTGKFLADTRAPSSLRRARCGRTPPKSYATACGLESAHAPLLAKTHPMNCTSP